MEIKEDLINWNGYYEKPRTKGQVLQLAEELLNKYPNSNEKEIYRLIEEHFNIKTSKLPNQENEDYHKPKIEKPRDNRLISAFISDLVDRIKDEDILFYRPEIRDIVEITIIKESEDKSYEGFQIIKPNRFITHIEKFIEPYNNVYNPRRKEMEAIKSSISPTLASITIASAKLQEELPIISKIFPVPLPILYEDKITFAKKGYDKRFNSWLSRDAPEIINPNMDLKDAKELIEKMFKGFCFASDKDKDKAIALLLTPFCRRLYKNNPVRTPLGFYVANRERAGKEYLANITGIVYEGVALEEPPLCNGENNKNSNSEELRKKFTSTLIAGRKRLHFSNNKGYINNAVLESFLTATHWSDRLLGKNDTFTFENEIEVSLSGNVGIGFTPDLANRSQFVNLFLDIEDANSRVFEIPDLHSWVKENRGLILSALYSLVRNWYDKKMPDGLIPFASFPEWSRVIGGIMECAGYSNPCIQDKSLLGLGGDAELEDMKELFELGYAYQKENPNKWIKREDLKNLVRKAQQEGSNIFSYLNFDERADTIKFGNKVIKYTGRVLSNIKLSVRDSSVRTARREYMFVIGNVGNLSLGNLGNLGNDRLVNDILVSNKYKDSKPLPTLPTLPEPPEEIIQDEEPINKEDLF